MARVDGLPEGQEKVRRVRSMFDAIAPRYDRLNRLLTLGMDVGWRRAAVSALGLAPGSFVVDVACGTGDFCRELMRRGLVCVGVDSSAGMLAAARTDAPLILADALALPLRAGVADGLTCGFALRNVERLDALFSEAARVVRRQGRVAFLEVAEPRHAVPAAVHRVYFHKVVPAIGGLLSDPDAYSYVPRSTAYLPPPGELLGILAGAGFSEVRRRPVGLGAAQIVTATRA